MKILKRVKSIGRNGVKGWSIGLAIVLAGMVEGSAVVFMGTGDPEHNTTEPEGELAGSGWQYLGQWGVFVGTVIGPHHFITARHVAGGVGQSFHYRGEKYTARAIYEFGPNDLRIWEVCEPMPGPYAPLYLDDDEVDKEIVVFGRGTQRGEAVFLEDDDGRHHRGWRSGKGDHRLRWGVNVVADVIDYSEFYDSAEEGELQFLSMNFDPGAGHDESHATLGDSGGAVFIDKDGTWALAGVLFGSFGWFNVESEDPGYFASLFDAGGFYTRSQVNDPVRRPRKNNIGCDNLGARGNEVIEWVFLEDLDENVANSFVATRISNYADWILRVMGGEVQPCFEGPWVEFSSTADGTFKFDPTQENDVAARTIRIPIRGDARFVRVNGCQKHPITDVSIDDGDLVVRY